MNPQPLAALRYIMHHSPGKYKVAFPRAPAPATRRCLADEARLSRLRLSVLGRRRTRCWKTPRCSRSATTSPSGGTVRARPER
jgi:hypothetical protein